MLLVNGRRRCKQLTWRVLRVAQLKLQGTEFVGYTAPSHTCNMSDSGLRTWAYETFKNIESIADNISAVYSNITLPVPQCKSE